MAHEIRAVYTTAKTLTARLVQGSTVSVSSISLTEQASLGYYTNASDITGLAAGTYQLLLMEGTTVLDARAFRWNGTAEILPSIAGDAMALTTGERSSVATAVRTELATELARVDVPISTREAESAAATRATTNQSEHDTTQAAIAALPAAPSAATVATAVRSELATELARVDATVSSRLPTASYVAPDNSGITTLTTRLSSTRADNLDNLDAAISTRESETAAAARASVNLSEHDTTQAAIAALPAAPSAATVATAVRTELATELARVDVPISTREAESAAATRATTNQTEHDATQTAIANLAIGGADPFALPAGSYAEGTMGNLIEKLGITPAGEGVTVVPAAPSDTGLCRVYGYLEGVDNVKALAGVEIRIKLVLPANAFVAASERLIGKLETIIRVDESGRLKGPDGSPWVDLQRNDQLTPANTYYLVNSRGMGVENAKITLASATANLRDLMLSATAV